MCKINISDKTCPRYKVATARFVPVITAILLLLFAFFAKSPVSAQIKLVLPVEQVNVNVVNSSRDYTWIDVESGIIESWFGSWAMNLQQAQEDASQYRFPNLYEHGFHITFTVDEDGEITFPVQKTGKLNQQYGDLWIHMPPDYDTQPYMDDGAVHLWCWLVVEHNGGWASPTNLINESFNYGQNCDTPIEEGTTGVLSWLVCPKGTLTISGTGAMPDYSWDSAPWFPHNDYIVKIIMENGVENIGNFAFNQCTRLTAVTIPNSVITIGNFAFNYCIRLTSVIIPESVETVGQNAFQSCLDLRASTIGSSVATIGSAAFGWCINLAEIINFAVEPQNISAGVFPGVQIYQCVLKVHSTSLAAYRSANTWKNFGNIVPINTLVPQSPTNLSVSLNDNEATVSWTNPNLTFSGIPLDELTSVSVYHNNGDNPVYVNSNPVIGANDECIVTLPKFGVHIFMVKVANGEGVNFASTEFLYLPDDINCDTPISGGMTGDLLWALCSDGTLTISGEDKMPDYSNGVPPWAEYRDFINSIIIEDGVENIGDGAFGSCAITFVSIPNSVTSIGINAFANCGLLESITIPNSVISIGISAFLNCYSLESINIPWSVTSIGTNAFNYCSNLKSINVDVNNTAYASENGVLLNKAKTELIRYPVGKLDTEYIIPGSVTVIKIRSFEGSIKLTSLTIPNSVLTIEEYVFASCSNLATIDIPDSVIELGDAAFWLCSSLGSVTIGSSVETIGNWAFSNCIKLYEIINYSIEPQLITNNVFQNIDLSKCALWVLEESIETYSASPIWEDFGNIVAIEDYDDCAFPIAEGKEGDISWKICPDWTLVISGEGDMPDYDEVKGSMPRTTNAPWSEFSQNIITVVIGEGVTSIGSYAFANCTNLVTVIISSTVTYIGDYAFEFCESLTDIFIYAITPPKVSPTAFWGVDLSSVTLHVPEEALDDYNESEDWGGFCNITILTGIKKETMLHTIAYPNPTDGIFTLQFEAEGTYNVTVSNITGKIVSRQTVTGHSAQMDISKQPAGIYLIVINDGKRNTTIRFIKK